MVTYSAWQFLPRSGNNPEPLVGLPVATYQEAEKARPSGLKIAKVTVTVERDRRFQPA